MQTISALASMVCGDDEAFVYRTATELHDFFIDCGLERYTQNGHSRHSFVDNTLRHLMSLQDWSSGGFLAELLKVIELLMDLADAKPEDPNRLNALEILNNTLKREGISAYYDVHGVCQLLRTRTNRNLPTGILPQRAWTAEEIEKRKELVRFIDMSSEDEITNEILLPLFRQLGFSRVTFDGHRERILEYGKDVWMKYQLPITHFLYFGIQVKKGKIDAAGRSKNTNVSEVLNQLRMMLGHEIFDPEINAKRLVDHAIIISGDEITRQAKNWLGEQLDQSKRSQVIFMDRNDILDLFLLHKVPLPS